MLLYCWINIHFQAESGNKARYTSYWLDVTILKTLERTPLWILRVYTWAQAIKICLPEPIDGHVTAYDGERILIEHV